MSDQSSSAPPGWYPDPEGGAAPRYWDGTQWAAPSAPSAPQQAAPVAAAPQPQQVAPAAVPAALPKKNRTLLIVLLVIGGVLLLGVIAIVLLIVFVFRAVEGSVDLALNAETGLADGDYALSPGSYTFVNERCSFSGTAFELPELTSTGRNVQVVGIGAEQCGQQGIDSVQTVEFVVEGGVARIVAAY